MARKSIRDELAVGRAFELKARHGSREPICVMIVRDPFKFHYGHPIAERIDERGMRSLGHWQGRFNAGSLQLRDFTSAKIARRRRDLERFDERDLDLIRYGIGLTFDGRFVRDGYSRQSIPDLPPQFSEIRWTLFWAPENWNFSLGFIGRDELRHALRGDWHMEAASGDWSSRISGWATAKTNPADLRRIEGILRRYHVNVQRTEFRFGAIANDKGHHIVPIGQTGPCFWSVTSAFHAADGTHAFSISSR